MTPRSQFRMSDLFARWALVELDLQEHMGIDIGDRDLMARRSWRWLRVRITGLLLSTPGSRLQREFAPEQTPQSMYPPPRER